MIGEVRNVFNKTGFIKRYPTIYDHVDRIRCICGIQVHNISPCPSTESICNEKEENFRPI